MRLPFFYGWIIVGIALLDTFAAGSHQNVFGILIEPVSRDMGWTRAQMIGVFTVATFTSGIAGPFLGPIIDKYGPRIPMALASFVGGFLLLAVAAMQDLWQFYLIYGIIYGLIRPSIGELAAGTTIANWFIKKRAVAYATASFALPLATGLLVPAAQLLVTHFGWRAVWVAFAVMMWLLVCLPSAIFMRRRPEDVGLLPDGMKPAANRAEAANGGALAVQGEVNVTLRQAIRSRSFWLLIVASMLSGGMAGPAIQLYLVPFIASKGLSLQLAAGGASILALGILGSRLVWGFLLTRIDVRAAFVLYGLTSASGVAVLMAVPPSPLMIYAAVGYLGVVMGGAYLIGNVIYPDYFGRASLGAIRGFQMPITAVGRGIAPLALAFIADSTGSYQASFGVAAALYFFAACVIYFARRPPSAPQKGVNA